MEEKKQEKKIEAYQLTILMPCLNEAANIGYALDAAQAFLQHSHIHGELLVVDNGSTDESVSIAKAHGARVITEPLKGYGMALRTGMKHAQGTYIIMGDCDSTYDFSDLMPFVEQLQNGYDFVIGNRFAGGIAKGAMPFSHRYFGVPFLSWLGRLRYQVAITDFHCGLRGFRADLAKTFSFQTTGMEFATELIAQFAKANARIIEVPTTLSVSVSPRKTHLKTIKDGIRHLLFMLKG